MSRISLSPVYYCRGETAERYAQCLQKTRPSTKGEGGFIFNFPPLAMYLHRAVGTCGEGGWTRDTISNGRPRIEKQSLPVWAASLPLRISIGLAGSSCNTRGRGCGSPGLGRLYDTWPTVLAQPATPLPESISSLGPRFEGREDLTLHKPFTPGEQKNNA